MNKIKRETAKKGNIEKKAFITATVASMIDLFNMDNIQILKELGYKVDIAANFKQGNVTDLERLRDFKLKMQEQGVEVYHVPIPRDIFCARDILKSYRILKKICDRERYSIVHTQTPIGGVVTRFACRNIRKSGTRVIYVAHGFHFFKGAPIKNWLLIYPIEWLSSFITDVLVTINREDYAFAKRHMKAKKLVYLPGAGIDVKKYENAVYNVKLREDLGIAKDAFVLIHVAEFSPNKNQKTVIQAIERLKNTNIVYVMCGIGEEKENLEKYVRSHKLQETVKFAGYREDIPELLKSADAFIFASYREGLSVALMEAMAVGMPVICSYIRGNIDLIKPQGGILVNPHSVDEFAEAINKMYHMFTEERELFCRMGAFNQKRVRKFGKNIVNDKMRDIYMER
ncbi:MAG: glycosyltransferase family 4 protein [Lachnospiraceae bacterium]|nr:glycosyltransferase family 4 protein [Lachnospiraceae bacterium]